MQVDEQPSAKAYSSDIMEQRRASNADASPSKAPDRNGHGSRPSSAVGVKPEDSPERSGGAKATASGTNADRAPSKCSHGSGLCSPLFTCFLRKM